jgi:hypothetical protein
MSINFNIWNIHSFGIKREKNKKYFFQLFHLRKKNLNKYKNNNKNLEIKY